MGEQAGCYHVLALIDLLCNSQEIGVLGSYRILHTRVLKGCLSWFWLEFLGVPSMIFMPHSCSIVELLSQKKTAPHLPMGGVSPWTLFLHLTQKQLGPEGPVCHSIGTACSLGKVLHLFSQYCNIAMMQSNQLLHSVANDLCLSNSTLKSDKVKHIHAHVNPY